ncbi:sensor histidine kinase [Sediminibacterium soli]|uniref:sensor histidine kinase n=1 Tax=Sediminibacterium soli TaxID=2698829 RepID=UPI00137B43F4|nr:ATP-binding protein [Sediminibacterium soli]NCI47821.1 hypothetical protein [Sediminibacterium soli]
MQVSPNDIVFIVIISSCCLFIAAAALITYVRLYNERKKKHFEEKELMAAEFDRQLMQSQLETQEETLNVVSRELHDNIGQLLNSTKLLIGVTERSLAAVPETLITAGQTLGQAIQELRALSKSLDKDWLSQFNFVENLEAEISRIHSAQTLHIEFSRPETLPLAPGQQIILFRIVQEIVQNVIKHAQAKKAVIRIVKYPGHLTLHISDDGIGFVGDDAPKGLGLRNIKHRTALLGGSVQWHTRPGGGTVVEISLPVNQTNE